MRQIFLSLTFIYSLCFSFAQAQESEEILRYHSEIEIQSDGSLLVTEEIQVRSTGNAIQRGIFRSFPVRYRDRYNNQVRVGFEVVEVLRDGESEPYQVIRQGDYEVVRIGEENTFLDPGIYDYTLVYTTNRQIGFFEDFDELYWNAIGDSWDFRILEASARVVLPEGGNMDQYTAYAGPAGSSDCPCDIEKESDRSLLVKVNEPLNAGEPLTVAVAWQKGLIAPPGTAQQTKEFLGDNAGIFTVLVGLILAFAYYFYAWSRVGKDPHKGGIYPLFEVPENLDAPAVRYLYKMGFDTKAYVAAIVALATNGWLKINEERKKKYELEKIDFPETSNSGYQRIMSNLFPGASQRISLNQKEHKKIGGAMKGLQKDLKERFQGSHFKNNYAWLVPGILISIASIILGVKYTMDNSLESENVFLIMGLFFCLFFLMFLGKVFMTIMHYLDYGYVKMSTIISEVFSFLFALAFPAVAIYFFDAQFPVGFLLTALVLGLINVVFAFLIKAPTEKGRRVMDEIEGFRMYLNAAEKPLLETYNPPGMTPEIFEKYLPYALALDVGESWGKAFENKINSLSGEERQATRRYQPSWYAGTGFAAGSLAGFSSNLGKSFGSALSNSASPPGSKSGSGGGGSSGGGGGGGGGGGW
ncbi:Predicted membrane protein [Cyclobacterium lianum]|uniref:Predicted membrane protein n=1 Tax=Cyclobacterium lianum TaxID=388280 RepID=A0A1M7I407_9BACT|nr:DUF2207 domain-containing protein [Cyclobacterium lianum]SHM35511.1 Predicted membrane protein [Cyclobacterium lianum]